MEKSAIIAQLFLRLKSNQSTPLALKDADNLNIINYLPGKNLSSLLAFCNDVISLPDRGVIVDRDNRKLGIFV